MKSFVIRVDLESNRGIKEGLPKLLELFKRLDVKASFYVAIGGESNIFEILKNRGKLKSAGERKIKVFSNFEKLRMVLFPKDFVKINEKILRRILEEGHELGLHGYKHRKWTRNLDSIDLDTEFKKMTKRYVYYFSQKPISFSSPGFNTNKKVLFFLNKYGFKFISDYPDFKTFDNVKNIPINLLGENNMPFIEYWVTKDKTDFEILEIFKRELKNKEFISFYLHGLFEGRYKIDLLEKMIFELKRNKFKSKRIIDFK